MFIKYSDGKIHSIIESKELTEEEKEELAKLAKKAVEKKDEEE
jgi:hypothetical protein